MDVINNEWVFCKRVLDSYETVDGMFVLDYEQSTDGEQNETIAELKKDKVPIVKTWLLFLFCFFVVTLATQQ